MSVHRFRYQDDYGQVYTVVWETTANGYLDITTETRQPFVWGGAAEGRVDPLDGCGSTRNLWRKGVRTVHRQVLESKDYGYDVVMEGYTQEVAVLQFTFNCYDPDEPVPVDPFKHHFGGGGVDSVTYSVSQGPRWADPEREGGDACDWSEVNSDGTTAADPAAFALVDAWG